MTAPAAAAAAGPARPAAVPAAAAHTRRRGRPGHRPGRAAAHRGQRGRGDGSLAGPVHPAAGPAEGPGRGPRRRDVLPASGDGCGGGCVGADVEAEPRQAGPVRHGGRQTARRGCAAGQGAGQTGRAGRCWTGWPGNGATTSMHVAAMWQRATAAGKVDMEAATHGRKLGWLAILDHRTSPECAAASGKNFYARRHARNRVSGGRSPCVSMRSRSAMARRSAAAEPGPGVREGGMKP